VQYKNFSNNVIYCVKFFNTLQESYEADLQFISIAFYCNAGACATEWKKLFSAIKRYRAGKSGTDYITLAQ
jgi:hypothetical protein